MTKKILLVVVGVAVSAIASTFLGRLALHFGNFGHMVRGMNRNPNLAANAYGNPLEATLHMMRLTTFVLDPIIAAIVGLVVGFWSDGRPTWLAAVSILPLAAFATYTYPWLWHGAVAGLIDLLVAAAAALATDGFRRRRRRAVGDLS